MFRIVNSKVYITRGETATYNVTIVNEQGVPYMIESTVTNPYIQFSVGKNINSTPEIVKYLKRTDKQFASLEVVNYPYPTWSTPPTVGNEGKLHRKTYGGQTAYAWYNTDTSAWVQYEFRIAFPIEHGDTKDFEAKTYKYDIHLIGGTTNEENDPPINITYDKPLLEATDFIVGGRVSG